jgi:hypothetical protein
MSVYHFKGVGLVGRSHSGPTPHEMKTGGNYELTRRYGKEFGGCAAASKYLRRVFHPLEPARDYPMSGPVTGWLKDFLPLDSDSELGKRHILLSKSPRLLEGINLSEKHPFDAVVRGGISYTLSRETLSAAVELPALNTGVGFTPPGRQPYFKVAAALGVAPDLLWQGEGYGLHRSYERYQPVRADSEWTTTVEGTKAMTLPLQLPYNPTR